MHYDCKLVMIFLVGFGAMYVSQCFVTKALNQSMFCAVEVCARVLYFCVDETIVFFLCSV